ncbi:MAG: hypothetical protein K6A98_06765 [Prevotella sp.]|nr:hypothetical protein [Prevotella sp.]
MLDTIASRLSTVCEHVFITNRPTSWPQTIDECLILSIPKGIERGSHIHRSAWVNIRVCVRDRSHGMERHDHLRLLTRQVVSLFPFSTGMLTCFACTMTGHGSDKNGSHHATLKLRAIETL